MIPMTPRTGTVMTANEIVRLPDVWNASMRKYGISARSIASKAGVNLPHFYHVLHKKSSPTLDYAAKIAGVIAEEIQRRESIPVGDPQPEPVVLPSDFDLPKES